jgi:heptose-I-phosphate ethanolaminephosphotransferase
MTRIPLFAWLSDEYIACHPDRYEALKQNQDKYFTNDLAYDLVCGLLDIRSPHFDETASLASPHYRFTRDMLLTYEGKKHISEDVGQ